MNKTLKKTLSIILTILMIVTTVPLAFAAGDGTPLIIDLSEVTSSYAEIGNGYDYYDEDGYIITGTNQNASVNIIEETALTLSNLTLGELYFNNAPDDSVINITLDGTTEVTEYISLYRAHLIFDGGETDILKAPHFTTGGNSGSVTVNGGNIILDCVTEYNISTITCDGGFTINGGTVTASNNYFYVVSHYVTLNGGELNIISTAADREAISSDITMDKGTLLTVSGAYGLISKDHGDILKADGLTESDYFFVRYDTESEFVPVYDIKAALDGKNYAEIKVDTHEHDFDNFGKCICGYECPHESYTDGVCENCGYECTHSWGEGVLTRPTLVGAGGIVGGEHWQEGYYTYTCSLCGDTYTEAVERADGSAFNYAVWEIKDCIGNEMLTQEARDEIHQSYLGVLENNSEFVDEEGFIRDDLIASEQGIIDEAVAELQKIIDTAEAKIASGEYVKADYSEIDEAIKAVDEALENATISEEMANELSDIKAQLETLKADSNTSAADLANNGLFDRVETITETMNNCADGNHTDADGDFLCDYGCGHEFEKPADTDCDHLCHKDGILGFFWKIISFFQRLFGIEQYCDCGALHYEKAIFG